MTNHQGSIPQPSIGLAGLRRLLRRILPTLVLSAGLAAAFLAHAVLRDRAIDRAAEDVRLQTRQIVAALQDRAQIAEFLMTAVGALYISSISVETSELNRFLDSLDGSANSAGLDFVSVVSEQEFLAGGQQPLAMYFYALAESNPSLHQRGAPLWRQAIQASRQNNRLAAIQNGKKTILSLPALTQNGLIHVVAQAEISNVVAALAHASARQPIIRLVQVGNEQESELLTADFSPDRPKENLEFSMLGQQWRLELQQRDNALLSADMVMARLALGFGMIASLILFYATLRQRQARYDADRARLQLSDAIESLSDAFVLFDAQDRVVLWNRQYAQVLNAVADELKPGVSFEALLRLGVERGLFPAAQDPEALIAQRLALHRQGGGSMEQEMADRRWVRVAEARTSDGGTAGIRVDITESKRREQLLINQVALLETVAQGGPLEDKLNQVMQWVENSIDGALTSLLRLDSSGTKIADYIPCRLPEGYMQQLVGLAIGTDIGSCGTAAYTRMPIYTTDIETDPRWALFRGLVAPFGLCACWSVPIIGTNGQVYGTFAVYFDAPRTPTKLEQSVLEIAGNLARLALERDLHMNRLTALARHDAVDRLSGGIAHDFNNLLQAMQQATDLLLSREPTPQQRPLLDLIREATAKGANLIRRLLVFARGQEQNREAISPDETIRALEPLLRQAITDTVALEMHLDLAGRTTQCDRVLLETALINLAINARDAMPDGGKLTITSRRLDTPKGIPSLELQPGSYACIAASDTGTGMAAETVRNAFVPYFSTKEVGRGSGLGLSMVYGFARGNGGSAGIESAPGHGTRVTIYLPLD